MHIPDGVLETKTWLASWAGSAGMLAYAARHVRRGVEDGRLVLMSVLAALLFALQMLNFPVAGGTSGHFAGGAVAAIVLGPWPAVLVMSTVLVIQAFVFADGGVAALGANIWNLGVVAPFVGWWVFAAFARLGRGRASRVTGAFVAAWLATVAAALAAGIEIWASGRAPFALVMGSMGFWHALIGIGEGAVTAGLVGYLLAVRPDLLAAEAASSEPVSRRALAGFAAAALAAAGVSFLASSRPDGLEHVAERIGFLPPKGVPTSFAGSPIPDYVVPGVANETLAGILAGVVGLVVAGLVAHALVKAARLRRAS